MYLSATRLPYPPRRGTVAVFVALCLTVLVGILAITLDGGRDPYGTAAASALDTAKANGYSNDGITSVVTVNIPPKTGDYVGKAGFAEVIVQYNLKRGFSAIWGKGTLPVTARAVASGVP